MIVEVKAWGNSYGIRLTKRDLERFRLRPGQRADLALEPLSDEPIDLSGIPLASDGAPFEQVRREHYTAKRRWER